MRPTIVIPVVLDVIILVLLIKKLEKRGVKLFKRFAK